MAAQLSPDTFAAIFPYSRVFLYCHRTFKEILMRRKVEKETMERRVSYQAAHKSRYTIHSFPSPGLLFMFYIVVLTWESSFVARLAGVPSRCNSLALCGEALQYDWGSRSSKDSMRYTRVGRLDRRHWDWLCCWFYVWYMNTVMWHEDALIIKKIKNILKYRSVTTKNRSNI